MFRVRFSGFVLRRGTTVPARYTEEYTAFQRVTRQFDDTDKGNAMNFIKKKKNTYIRAVHWQDTFRNVSNKVTL